MKQSPNNGLNTTAMDLASTPDLQLPAWGPYTDDLAGISHVANSERGWRWDLAIGPVLYRRNKGPCVLPDVNYECNYHPWSAQPDLLHYTFRHDLVGHDSVYADVSFFGESESQLSAEVVFHNTTEQPQTVALHLIASLHYPRVQQERGNEALAHAIIHLPEGASWIDGTSYTELVEVEKGANYSLVYANEKAGCALGSGFINGKYLRLPGARGTHVTYQCQTQAHENAVMYLRYRIRPEDWRYGKVNLTIGNFNRCIDLPVGNGIQTLRVPIGKLQAGDHNIQFTAGGCQIELDGFAFVSEQDAGQITVSVESLNPIPGISELNSGQARIYKYEGLEYYYGLAWDSDALTEQSYFGRLSINETHIHGTRKELEPLRIGTKPPDPERRFHHDTLLRPLQLQPRSQLTIRFYICKDSRESVVRQLEGFHRTENKAVAVPVAETSPNNPAGEKYGFSQRLMAATLLTNVLYPVRVHNQWIKHGVPGKLWQSLYTWDSGFIAMGLLEYDVNRALQCINTYLTAPDNDRCAFILHGSPVPTQIIAVYEFWQRTQNRELLAYFFPRLRKMHRFLAGREGSSTSRRLKSGMLTTWNYFLDVSGVDDQPPQVHAVFNRLTDCIAPVFLNAILCRTSILLARMAIELGEDHLEFRVDYEFLSTALLKHSWDDDAGYFSYVVHDEQGQPLHVLRAENGENYNRTLEGIAPLLANIGDHKQRNRMLAHLKDPERFMTDYGLTHVDRSSSYSIRDGYWNGSIWMPHQWFFWKTMLDLGESDFAARIAFTALDLWKRETENTHHCFEHFNAESGCGGGWHQFGGLSSPVVVWFAAYHTPGTVTTGFDTWIHETNWQEDFQGLSLLLSNHSDTPSTLIVVMDQASDYLVTYDDKPVTHVSRVPGCLELLIPAESFRLRIGVKKVNVSAE